MARPSIAMVIALLVIITSPNARAQAPACAAAPTVRVSAGIAQSDRVDKTASPVQYGGRGVDLSGAFETARGSMCYSATARGGAKTLTAVSGPTGTEQLIDGELGITALRALGTNPHARRSFAVGADLHGELAVTNHRYGDPEGTTSQFRVGVVSLGPAVRWRESVPGGAATLQLSSPLVSLVDHPYSAITADRSSPRIRAASLGTLRGLRGSLTYEWAASRRLSVFTSYQASLMRYDDVRPLRSLTQSLTFGIGSPLGGGSR